MSAQLDFMKVNFFILHAIIFRLSHLIPPLDTRENGNLNENFRQQKMYKEGKNEQHIEKNKGILNYSCHIFIIL